MRPRVELIRSRCVIKHVGFQKREPASRWLLFFSFLGYYLRRGYSGPSLVRNRGQALIF